MSHSPKREESFLSMLTFTAIAGGTTGAIEATCMYPAEFVKTQLQLQNKLSTQPKFAGPFHCVQVTVQQHGVLGMYRGLSSLIAGSVPKTGVRFTTMELLKKIAQDENGKVSPGRIALAGFGAGASEAIFAVTPMEVIKTQFIADQNHPPDQRKYKGLRHGVAAIVKAEGLKGLYKGLAPTILKQGSNQASRFFVFEELKKYFQHGDSKAKLGFFTSFFCGGTAGAVSVMLNNPFDVIKTQMQGLDANKYKSTIDCGMKIFRLQGPLFFYKGVAPRLVRVCGDSALTFTIFNTLIQFFRDTLYPKN